LLGGRSGGPTNLILWEGKVSDDTDEPGEVTGRDPLELLVERLAGSGLPANEQDLVLAAAISDEALRQCIGGDLPDRPRPDASPRRLPPATFLSGITVTGLRGVGETAEVALNPGPGMTLIVGRNGSGKSSFAEAIELALTGTSSRWSSRNKEWLEGWPNLHYSGERQVDLQLCIEGVPGDVTVRRTWPPGAGLEEAVAFAQRAGERRTTIAELGFDAALSTWRPFLSYNELGGLLEDGPSRLYDAISRVLGFEQWVEVERRLTVARKSLEDETKAARTEAESLRGLLGVLDDDRAIAVLAALPLRKPWDLPTIESHVVTGTEPATTSIETLQALAGLARLDEDQITRRAAALGRALEEAKTTAGTDAGRARQLAVLLQQALDVHALQPDGSCPVCGTSGVLTDTWRESALVQIAHLKTEAASADMAVTAVSTAVRDTRALFSAAPTAVIDMATGVDTAKLKDLWQLWSQAPDSPEDLLTHLAQSHELQAAITEVRDAARAELQRRQDLWKPIAAQLAAWLPGAKRSQASTDNAKHLKSAAEWVNEEINWLRNERFAPIAKQVQAVWERLRQTSSVSLDGVKLEGTKTRRHVSVSVSVDDAAGAALAVMSQGELHALALSLFLPRATLPESPFRFVVIDDPVQAMDAARVDGLALALSDVAATHQVVVLTQDERLPEAVRRLGLAARVLEVSRRDHSRVTVRVRNHPVDDYISDARAVCLTVDYPPEAIERVVPGLCRNAVEAACLEVARRHLLAAARSHLDVQDILTQTVKLKPRLALVLWDDPEKGNKVVGEIYRRWGQQYGDCLKYLDGAVHEVLGLDIKNLIKTSEQLAYKIMALP
jgi:ABC-type molybdenum transport system ATPase subunit/photorepair protein PhrA